MSDVAAYNKLASPPDDIAHHIASAQTHGPDCATEEAFLEMDACCDETLADHASNVPNHPLLATPIPRDGIKRWARALLEPLIAIATTQYVIVTALAALTAITVASEAAKIINTQLAPILTALKRL